MIDDKKSKLFLSNMNNIHVEYEKLIDELAKEFH